MPEAGGVVRIEGMRSLRRTLKQAGVNLQDLKDLNRQAGNIVLPVARATAPVGPEVNGHISRTVRLGVTNTAAIIRVGNNGRFPYAQPIHWGWFRHGIKPNPWVSRAAQSTESRWLEIYWRGLNNVIDHIEGA